MTAPKVQWPFMVFAEALPEAAKLADPKTPAAEKDRLMAGVNASIEVVKDFAERDTQRGRHAANHRKRDRIMAGLKRDARGKPMRDEPKRLAKAHGVHVWQIRKWIEQLRNAPPLGAAAVRNDWRTVYYGQALSHQRSIIGRQKHKLPMS